MSNSEDKEKRVYCRRGVVELTDRDHPNASKVLYLADQLIIGRELDILSIVICHMACPVRFCHVFEVSLDR